MRNFRTALLSLAAVLVASGAHADYDMSGKWLMLGPTGSPAGRLTVTQSSGVLTVAAEGGAVPWEGTIDEMTGAFHLEASFYTFPMCSTWTIDGTVAADGRSFTATRHSGSFSGVTPHTLQCIESTIAIDGTRCGNTVLESFEDCDLGDAASGDCCSPACTFDAVGTACTSDGNVCTDDVCDGAGTCTNEERSGSCELPGGCGSGDCSAGSCVVTSALPAGTSCDLDASVCTPDLCDEYGQCVAGTQIDCSPCGECDDEQGCVAYPMYCEYDPEAVKLSLRTGDDPAKRSLKLSVKSRDFWVYPTPELDMAVCIFEDVGGVLRPVVNARIPSDGPWEEISHGHWRYKDKTRSEGGVLKMSVDPERGAKVVAGRENLPLTLALPTDSTLTARIAHAGPVSFPSFPACSEHSVETDKQTDTTYKGSYAAAP